MSLNCLNLFKGKITMLTEHDMTEKLLKQLITEKNKN